VAVRPTIESVEARILALEDARDTMLLLPVKGKVGNTDIDLTGRLADIERELARKKMVLQGLYNGGVVPTTRRCC